MNESLTTNSFREGLVAGQTLIGLWCSLCNNLSTEVVVGAGFDWLLVDTEHAPNEVPMVFSQLQAIAGSRSAAVVRPAWNDVVLIKRLLDIGCRNLLIPYVQTAAEARLAVAATRYPPAGVRGVAVLHRANAYGRIKDYLVRANEHITVIVQIETREAVNNLEAIAEVPGIDALFIGPSDLAAAHGHLGAPGHPTVQAVIEEIIARARKAGKPVGILAPVEADARRWLERGCTLVAVGSDIGLLARHADTLAHTFRPAQP